MNANYPSSAFDIRELAEMQIEEQRRLQPPFDIDKFAKEYANCLDNANVRSVIDAEIKRGQGNAKITYYAITTACADYAKRFAEYK